MNNFKLTFPNSHNFKQVYDLLWKLCEDLENLKGKGNLGNVVFEFCDDEENVIDIDVTCTNKKGQPTEGEAHFIGSITALVKQYVETDCYIVGLPWDSGIDTKRLSKAIKHSKDTLKTMYEKMFEFISKGKMLTVNQKRSSIDSKITVDDKFNTAYVYKWVETPVEAVKADEPKSKDNDGFKFGGFIGKVKPSEPKAKRMSLKDVSSLSEPEARVAYTAAEIERMPIMSSWIKDRQDPFSVDVTKFVGKTRRVN